MIISSTVNVNDKSRQDQHSPLVELKLGKGFLSFLNFQFIVSGCLFPRQ